MMLRTARKLLLAALAWFLAVQLPQAAAPVKSTKADKPSASSAREPGVVGAEIDRLIDAALAREKLPASPVADDAEFHRRVTLDITGRVPTVEKTLAFLKDTDPNKRAKLIDELLASPEYGEHFGMIWYHRIVKRDDDNRFLVSDKLQNWLSDRFNKNDGWDRIVSDILTAKGNRDTNPETIFFLTNVSDAKSGQPAPNKLTAAASKLFLGIKLECCECHNHPFATYKQTDFWGMAAFFNTTHAENSGQKAAKNGGAVPSVHEGGAAKGGKKKGDTGEKAPAGSIVIPDTKGQTVKAKFFTAEEPSLAGKSEVRPVLAAWLTSPHNPFFARAQVNKIWANFFARGIVDPVDDMRNPSKATHPELLDLLAAEFIASGFDQKHLIRCICNSKVYQQTSKPLPGNKEDDKWYSHAPLKVMSADMLYDSLRVVLGHAAADQEKAKGKAARRVGGPREAFRKFFHAEADDDVGVVEDYTHGVPQALRLMNSTQTNNAKATVERLTKASDQPEQVIDGLYLTVLSRRPTEAETKRMKEYVAGEKDALKGYSDLMWVLLNSGEFLFNH